ncbi:uncharacterized protein HaLaN_01367 [Haematococcus lacustris]|uniref:NFACT protein C-terminal domain-containing protein n=1 Tax=Haematococcus lacustris TaxID=44745 RepID=A0A699Y938_HAELA|nr:uncharacterized protein HaLaN_01367 [Haematococcus lacustris]
MAQPKLVPVLDTRLGAGTLKKGKAARQGVELLSRAPDASQRERELLKAVPEMDMINAMVGSVKLSMPGLTKLKQVEKKDKKAAEKEPPSQVATASGTRQDQVQAQGSKPAYGASYYTGLLTNDIQTDNKATAGDMLKRSLQLAGCSD